MAKKKRSGFSSLKPCSCCRITGTGARGRNGDELLFPPRRTRSSRCRQISLRTCIPPGGWLFQPGAGAVLHMHRCGSSRHQFQVYRWMIAVRLLAFVHQSYDCCTIITHMSINHLKDGILHTTRKTTPFTMILNRAPFPQYPTL